MMLPYCRTPSLYFMHRANPLTLNIYADAYLREGAIPIVSSLSPLYAIATAPHASCVLHACVLLQCAAASLLLTSSE